MFAVCRSGVKFPKGILKNLCVWVGTLYAPTDFMVIETGKDERAPIILWRPFLNTSGAVIYASAAKISFYIKGRKETFSLKNKTTQIPEQSRHEPRKRTNRRNRNKQVWTKSVKMVTAVHGGQDGRLKSPFLTKKDDPGMLSIYCSINGYNFYKTFCDTRSGVNIILKGWRYSNWSPCQNRRPFCPYRLSGYWHGRRWVWSTHHPWKTIPQHR